MSASDSSALEVAELLVECKVNLSMSMPTFANVAFTQRASHWKVRLCDPETEIGVSPHFEL